MAMRLNNEDQILDEDVRKRIIEEIEGAENVRRRSEAYRWHEIWKNKSKEFVRELLSLMLDFSTVAEMEYTISNISIAKKIVDKLAKVYANGVTRKYEQDSDTEALNCLEDKLEINTQMKTSNKLLKLLRNAVLYIKPVMFIDKLGERKWRPAWVPMSSHLYDVVEMENDRTKPMVFILSNFERSAVTLGLGHGRVPDLAARHRIGSNPSFKGDGIDQKIADKKEDANEAGEQKKVYIWWTDKYHFTTLGAEIIDPVTKEPVKLVADELLEFVENPINMKPFVDLHIDQEGHYWAEGGEDLIDGDLLINTLISNHNHIGVTQGFGQLVLTGKNLPNSVKLGPNKIIGLPTDDDGIKTDAKFITASPPLDALARQVEMYVALLLTTNNLSTNGVQSRLEGGMAFPSGIAMALDKAESLEDVNDQREIFLKAEKKAFKITAAWIQSFDEDNELDENFADCKIPLDIQPTTEFNDAMIIMSEKEKLENLKIRQDLGINREIELIMKDRGITEKDAEKILLLVTEERLKKMVEMMGQQEQEGENNGNQDNEDDS